MEPALKSSSISSFKGQRLPCAFLTALGLIFFVETGLYLTYRLTDRYGGDSSNWQHVKKIEKGQIDKRSPLVILGDSTAVPLGAQKERLADLGATDLSLKVWDTMAGEYFILKKYLESGARPRVCVLLTTDYFWEEEMKTQSAIDGAKESLFRPLGSWSNIFDLAFRAKRPDMARQMILEGILPSKRFKVPISNWLGRGGVYQLDIQPLTGWEARTDPKGEIPIGPDRFRTAPVQLSSLSLHYFPRIRELCRRQGIQLVVLESSVSVSRRERENPVHEEYVRQLSDFLARQGVPYQSRRFVFPDEKFGKDKVHVLDEEFRRQYADLLMAEVAPYLNR